MRPAPVKSLVDATLAPPGKKWSYDTLTFTPVPDADVDLPNFDQWLNPSIEAPVSSQKVPAIIDDELDAELTMQGRQPRHRFRRNFQRC
eukprot:scaffold100398_cov87-Phaeocystis_antarctica.AAC.1